MPLAYMSQKIFFQPEIKQPPHFPLETAYNFNLLRNSVHLTLTGLQKRQSEVLGNICTVACIRERGVAIASATPQTNPACLLIPFK